MASIELRSFTTRVGGRLLIDNIDATLDWQDNERRVIALMGPSGAGKTTLARAILSDRYEVRVKGLRINPSELTIAYVPQSPVLFPHLSADRNARLFSFMGRYQKRFDSELFDTLAGQLRLVSILNSTTNVERLSGGEAQRLMLLRTLSVRPDLIVLDEPASGLDPSVREAFLIDLQDLLTRLNIDALYISHHWDEVAFLADQVAFAITSGGPNQHSVINALPVAARAEFEQSPPTIDAFRAVYGPGCSIWPVVEIGGEHTLRDIVSIDGLQSSIACFGADRGTDNLGYLRVGEFRLARSIIQQMRYFGALRAAVYRDGRFQGWSGVSSGSLEGGRQW